MSLRTHSSRPHPWEAKGMAPEERYENLVDEFVGG
jgi:hypothetical protein